MIKENRFLPRKKIPASQKKFLIQNLKDLLSQDQRIIFAYLFGSFINEDTFRDIDVAIYHQEKSGTPLEFELSEKLTSALNFQVEVRTLNDAPLPFQMSVLREGKLLFSHDENFRTDFIEKVSRRYWEYVHFRNLFLEIDGKGNVASS